VPLRYLAIIWEKRNATTHRSTEYTMKSRSKRMTKWSVPRTVAASAPSSA
jgi:hypothetical protein